MTLNPAFGTSSVNKSVDKRKPKQSSFVCVKIHNTNDRNVVLFCFVFFLLYGGSETLTRAVTSQISAGTTRNITPNYTNSQSENKTIN